MALTNREFAAWNMPRRAGRALAMALLMGVVGCGGEVTDTDEGTAGQSSLEDEAGAKKGAAATGKATSAVVEVDPQEYTDFLAEQDAVTGESRPKFVEAKRVTVNYENGRRKREYVLNVYKDSPPAFQGVFREWYENGQLWKQGSYENGSKVGSWKFWADDGTLLKAGDYASGQPDGQWTYHRPDGTLSRIESFAGGKKDGDWVTYDETGKHVIQRQTFRDGTIHGAVVAHYAPKPGAEGALQKRREIQFVDGRQHGTAIEWYENGQMRVKMEFRNGKRHGPATEWDQAGTVLTQREFRDGEPVD